MTSCVKNRVCKVSFLFAVDTHTFRMLNLGCGQYLRNPFFPGFWGQKWGCGFCILADYTRLYTVNRIYHSCSCIIEFIQIVAKKVIKCLTSLAFYLFSPTCLINEPVHEISNNVVCATSKASNQPAHMRSLIRAFASRLSIL